MQEESPIKLHIVLDNVRSAFNVGSIFRTADAIGGVKLHLCGLTTDIDNPKLDKTALGASSSVPSTHYPDPLDAIKQLKAEGIPIYAVELTDKAEHFQKVEYPSPVALVLGHERLGVSQQILEMADKHIYIPMHGIKESLNVANTAAIIMYEAVRGVV